jgi:hypothetical protein
LKKYSTALTHQGNANQSHSEILLTPVTMAITKRQKITNAVERNVN